MSHIPVANIFHMLCYAWDVLPESTATNVQALDTDKPVDLFAKMLINGTHHLMRRGIEQGYLEFEEETASLRGRIDFAGSARRMVLQNGRAFCQFDELSPDIPTNQILKATLSVLARTSDLESSLRRGCGLLVRRFSAVTDIRLTRGDFSRVQLHGNNRYYRFLLNLCELIFDCALLDERDGTYRVRDVLREDKPMARLFEKFIFNFFAKEQSEYKVSSDRIYWQAQSEDDQALALLPTMLTDISLRSKDRTIIIDAKYYSKTLQTYYDRQSVHSSNLYQIYAYLKNLEAVGGNDAKAAGILLYPVTDEPLDHRYVIDGHAVQVATLDLSASWEEVELQLMGLVA